MIVTEAQDFWAELLVFVGRKTSNPDWDQSNYKSKVGVGGSIWPLENCEITEKYNYVVEF